MVEAPLEPAERIETEQEDGQHVEDQDDSDPQHKVGKVLLTQVLQRTIQVCVFLWQAVTCDVPKGHWHRDEVKGHIEQLDVGEEEKGGKDVNERGLDIPLPLDASDAPVERLPEEDC